MIITSVGTLLQKQLFSNIKNIENRLSMTLYFEKF